MDWTGLDWVAWLDAMDWVAFDWVGFFFDWTGLGGLHRLGGLDWVGIRFDWVGIILDWVGHLLIQPGARSAPAKKTTLSAQNPYNTLYFQRNRRAKRAGNPEIGHS